MKEFCSALRILGVLTMLTGVLYPLGITVIGKVFWPYQANGSLLVNADQQIVGSELIGQKFTQETYFHSRPSAADYATIPSGASNLAATSRKLAERIHLDLRLYQGVAPADLITTSASGLDPHLSPEAVFFQSDRVGKARHFTPDQTHRLAARVEELIERPKLGIIGSPVINVVQLNRILESEFL